jgi:asparagine synthase (glutamine-hydrolysing)
LGKGLRIPVLQNYSHENRWRTTQRGKRFFGEDLRCAIDEQVNSTRQALLYPEGFMQWDPLSRAQYLESTIFLSQYLLSSQGDRVAMAHSVEGRFPFLDHRVVEFQHEITSPSQALWIERKIPAQAIG